MSDTIYFKLRDFLNQFPLGYPETKSGVEIKILKRLFSEEEAELTTRLTPIPEEAEAIAQRLDMDADLLEERLNTMAGKGLVFKARRQDKIVFRVIPFMVGLYEYSVKKIDPELAALFKEYYDTAYLNEIGASRVPGLKVIPVEESVDGGTVLLPYHKLTESVRTAKKISVAECMCRKEARMLGEGCDHPLETCLTFNATAEYYIESGLGREITVEEALKILKEADDAGLVHTAANFKRHSNICSCCPCCCAFMKGITQRGHETQRYLNANFEAVLDESECT
ncbi:MAG: hypothetical protein GY866_29985, partial [Proteobacteria bacterium]|nr:hypothetical protein [Pseudomonadota bacterium]